MTFLNEYRRLTPRRDFAALLKAQELGRDAIQTVISKHLKHNIDEHAAQVNGSDKNYPTPEFLKRGWRLIVSPVSRWIIHTKFLISKIVSEQKAIMWIL